LISFWFGWNPRDVNFLKMTKWKYSCKLQIQIINDLPRRVWCAVMLCFGLGKVENQSFLNQWHFSRWAQSPIKWTLKIGYKICEQHKHFQLTQELSWI
jgi:hypothetical protein